jgi:hypothetical protein
MLKLRNGTTKSDKLQLLTWTCIKPTTQLVRSLSGAPSVLGQPWATLDSQDSPQPELRGNHHLPPYNILCSSPRGRHPNGFLSRDSQVGVPKFQQLGLSQLLRCITSCADLRSQWVWKQSCSPYRELSNDMLHFTCTHQSQVDSRLLVVESQIVKL